MQGLSCRNTKYNLAVRENFIFLLLLEFLQCAENFALRTACKFYSLYGQLQNVCGKNNLQRFYLTMANLPLSFAGTDYFQDQIQTAYDI